MFVHMSVCKGAQISIGCRIIFTENRRDHPKVMQLSSRIIGPSGPLWALACRKPDVDTFFVNSSWGSNTKFSKGNSVLRGTQNRDSYANAVGKKIFKRGFFAFQRTEGTWRTIRPHEGPLGHMKDHRPKGSLTLNHSAWIHTFWHVHLHTSLIYAYVYTTLTK